MILSDFDKLHDKLIRKFFCIRQSSGASMKKFCLAQALFEYRRVQNEFSSTLFKYSHGWSAPIDTMSFFVTAMFVTCSSFQVSGVSSSDHAWLWWIRCQCRSYNRVSLQNNWIQKGSHINDWVRLLLEHPVFIPVKDEGELPGLQSCLEESRSALRVHAIINMTTRFCIQ